MRKVLANAIAVQFSVATSVDESDHEQGASVVTTIGERFPIRPGVWTKIQRVEVWDASGKQIDRLTDPVWDATRFEAGLYHLRAFFQDGGDAVQRFLVSR